MARDRVREALIALRTAMRAADDGRPLSGRMQLAIPPGRHHLGHSVVCLDDAAADALSAASRVLTSDLRFEHVDRPSRALETFAVESFLEADGDLVDKFLAEHSRDLREHLCYVAVLHLTVQATTTVGGLELLPIDHPDVPEALVPIPPTAAGATTVARVAVRGTSLAKMADRARATVRHQLMTLRIALRDHPGIHDQQLRFRVGEQVIFDGGAAGWARPAGGAFDLEIVGDLADFVRSRPVIGVAEQAAGDLVGKARLAATWMERARFADEPLVALLFLFFALESLLGKRPDQKKAFPLAERQMTLAHAVRGGFKHPDDTWLLYDKVRSAAVHGELAPPIDQRRVQGFEARVRETLTDYLQLGEQQGFRRRGRLLTYLDNHPDLPALREWVRLNADPGWARFFGETERSPARP